MIFSLHSKLGAKVLGWNLSTFLKFCSVKHRFYGWSVSANCNKKLRIMDKTSPGITWTFCDQAITFRLFQVKERSPPKQKSWSFWAQLLRSSKQNFRVFRKLQSLFHGGMYESAFSVFHMCWTTSHSSLEVANSLLLGRHFGLFGHLLGWPRSKLLFELFLLNFSRVLVPSPLI